MAEERHKKKNVVYLIGTGVSHAEIKQRNPANRGVLMDHVAKGIFDKLIKRGDPDPSIKELLDISDPGTPKPYKIDIESVITLYEATGTAIDKIRANKLKRYFREVITERTKQINALQGHPKLLSALVDMHTIEELEENLRAIITINYDDFIERALLNVHDGLNLPFEIDKPFPFKVDRSIPTLCKLHGSFDWENANPVKIHDLPREEDENKFLWVPPGVTKRIDLYPFNAIWGAARKSLKCDILRIIGCSLNKNDWGLITLLHTTNRLRNNITEKYEIQYIDYPRSFDTVQKDFPYFLKLKSITQLPEFELYMRAEYKDKYQRTKGETEKEQMDTWLNDNNSFNIFAEWLKAMAYYLRIGKGIDISTDKGYFSSFFLNGG